MVRVNRLPFIKPDENLAKIVGTETLQTHLIIKRFWQYVKDHRLKINYNDYKK